MDRIHQNLIFIFMILFSLSAASDPIKFIVENNTSATLIALQISANNYSWSSFGSVNLSPSNSAVFEWIPTPESNCVQYVRGNFKKGGWSAPIKIDFCKNPNVKITFGS